MAGIGYSKMSQNAIAAMSYLAAQYPDHESLARSATIAEARDLPQTLVAKILTILSQAGYVQGSPGPKGGYRLARPPETITFHDIVAQFDPASDPYPCPFGAGYCPNDNPCPVHDELVAMRESSESFLKNTHFGSFVVELE